MAEDYRSKWLQAEADLKEALAAVRDMQAEIARLRAALDLVRPVSRPEDGAKFAAWLTIDEAAQISRAKGK